MRKIIQICESATDSHYGLAANITALCDDGSLWALSSQCANWQRLPDIPQDESPQISPTPTHENRILESD